MDREESFNFIRFSKTQCFSCLPPNFLFGAYAVMLDPYSKEMVIKRFIDSPMDPKTIITLLWVAIGVVVAMDVSLIGLYIRLSEMKKLLDKNPMAYIEGDYQNLCRQLMLNPFSFSKINSDLVRTRGWE